MPTMPSRHLRFWNTEEDQRPFGDLPEDTLRVQAALVV
jgi:hypothetical protein